MIRITLKAARVNRGLTQIEASKLFGIHKDTLSSYEIDSTHIPRSFFIRIEEVYGIPVENIFFGKQSEFFRKESVMSTA